MSVSAAVDSHSTGDPADPRWLTSPSSVGIARASGQDRPVAYEEGFLRCEVVAWVSQDFPGWVRVRLVDADGKSWFFVDKVPVFTGGQLSADTPLPAPLHVRCGIVGRNDDRALVISTQPDGVEAEGGQRLFRVREDQLDRHTV